MPETPATYDEPWQAELMATVFALQEHGIVDARAMTDALAARRRTDRPDGNRYFEDVLEALEEVLANSTGIDAGVIGERMVAWRAAYLATPHGKPVRLDA